jgi:hydrogenase small subunit
MTQASQNRTNKWNKDGNVPSGWGHLAEPSVLEKVAHFAYEKLQFKNSPKPGSKVK